MTLCLVGYTHKHEFFNGVCECGKENMPNEIELIGEDYLKVGLDQKLTVKVYLEDVDLQYLRWTSSDTKILTVEDGKVKAIGEGYAIIKAQSYYGPSNEIEIFSGYELPNYTKLD